MADDRAKLTDERAKLAKTSEDIDIYYEQSPKSRFLQVFFVAMVTIMVIVTIALSIYRGLKLEEYGSSYFMLGVSLVGFVVIEIILIHFIRKEDLPREKSWFLYFVGACITMEAVFTDILLFY